MHFNNLSGLWALAGLLIPVAIHLLSRQEGRTITVGSLRHLSESPTARFRHIMPNELVLLALRCVLIILFALILAGLRLNIPNAEKQRWVIVEKGITNNGPIQSLIDSLTEAGFEARLLSKDFPPLKDSASDFGPAQYWSLAEDLRTRNLDSVVVLAFNYYRNFQGPRVNLPSHVRWLGIEGPEAEFVAQEINPENDSSWVRRGSTSSLLTHFQTVKQNMSSDGDGPVEISIQIVSTDNFLRDKEIVMAALQAVQSITPHRIEITSVAPGKIPTSNIPGWIVWLSDSAFERAPGYQSIVYMNCVSKHLPLLTPAQQAKFRCGDSQATWIITSRLNEEVAMQENFALVLANLILPPAKTVPVDNRVLPETMLWSRAKQSTAAVAGLDRPLETFLIILLLFFLAMERWLAFKKHQ